MAEAPSDPVDRDDDGRSGVARSRGRRNMVSRSRETELGAMDATGCGLLSFPVGVQYSCNSTSQKPP